MTADVDELPALSVQPSDVEIVPLDSVMPWPGNPRRGDITAIRKSIRRFGQQRPILVQRETNLIVAGNHLWHALVAENEEAERLEAATPDPLRGPEHWPDGLRTWPGILIARTDLTDMEARAYLITDNRMSELGQSDPDALAHWLAGLVSDGAVDDALGYASEDIDKMLRSISEERPSDDAVPPLAAPGDVWVKPGQMFAMGRHRLLVGDATQPESYARLMGGKTAGLIWTDPPYGIAYQAGARGTRDGLQAIIGDEIDDVALRTLLDVSLGAAIEHLRPGSAMYCAAASGTADVFVGCLKALGVYRQTIMWVKDQLVLGRADYQWRHEEVHLGVKSPEGRKGKPVAKASNPIYYGWRPGAAHYFVTDRTLDTVWEIARPRASAEHPTMKPVDLVERCVLASSRRGDIVLDPFVGSGTTLVVAERTGRTGYSLELDPRYALVVLDRMEALFGLKAQEIDG